jgi:hypothetical protein
MPSGGVLDAKGHLPKRNGFVVETLRLINSSREDKIESWTPTIREIGGVTAREIETLREKFTLARDARDVLAARDSVKPLLGIQD